MIWLLIPALLLLCFAIHFMLTTDIDDCWGWLAGALAAVGIIVLFSLITTGFVISYQTSLVECRRDLAIVEERYKEQAKVILTTMKMYPMEEELLKNFDPTILLKLPEIKSNELLTKQIGTLVKIKDKIYEIQLKATGYMQSLDFHQRRWFSLTLVNPTYDEDIMTK